MNWFAGRHDHLILNGSHSDDARLAQILLAGLELEAFHFELVIGGCLKGLGGQFDRLATNANQFNFF